MWTEQTVETLRKLALEGRSAAWIAAAIGAPSRSAVIGKANRIGVKLNGAPCRGAADRARLRSPARQIAWARPRPLEG
ncbi:MAG TPA: GcrA family cell cycle regulator, partial [Roseiarcus sp.]|nr:GcrA family cell cycle regulator [Roseiarcus sp.]